ncbi:MAG: hypothetical protein AB7I30_15970, partial [Isosphaeraceae bacterium]
MTRDAKNLDRRRRRLGLTGLERLEERALLSFAAADVTAFGADGPAARPVETSGVAVDAAGNRYVSGSFEGTITWGGASLKSAGGRDAFVAKFGPDGSLLFARSAGGSLDDAAFGIALDAKGNAYLTGEFRGVANFQGGSLDAGAGVGLFVWSIGTDGATRFATGATGGEARGFGVAVNPEGTSIAVAGAFRGSVAFGGRTLSNGSNQDAGLVARLDSSGSFAWANAFLGVDGSSGARFNAVAIAPGGAVVGAGRFQGIVDFDPGLVLSGRTSVGGTSDLAVVGLSPIGEFAWATTAGGAGHDAATGLAIDGKGKVFVTGSYQQSVDFGPAGKLNAPAGKTAFYLLGLHAGGSWVTDLGATHPDLTGEGFGKPSVVVNAAGGVVVATTFSGPAKLGRFWTDRGAGDHALVESFDGAGNLVRVFSVGGSGRQTVTGVALDDAGRVALTGTFTGLIGMGNTSIDSEGAKPNAFLAGLKPVSQAPDDFFGTNRTQPALYAPSTSVWSVQGPFSPGTYGTFGQPGDISVPGDYERNGTTQMAIFRPSTAEWIVMTPNGPRVIAKFGAPNLMDVPAPADYDGAGYTQPAVFRPSTGEWFVLGSNGARALGSFGASNLTDLPVPADYDGDGKAEPAVFRPSTAQWFVKTPEGGKLLATFGATNLTDLPTPGDFDGDGKAEPAVYRKATAEWFALTPNGGRKVATFGTPNGNQVPANGPASFLQAWEASKARPTTPPPPPT